ncbi:competence protein [Flavobacterium rhizosphaerae]|uniref:Competence protein n=1 Tax=Flavobacterium rhizosphaerae TaxID=3163298 RepID=A0ABW8Z141_9FLAO
MAFENIKDSAEDLKNETKNLIDASVRYYKLLGFKIAVRAVSSIFRVFILAILLCFLVLFFSLAVSMGLGYWLNNFAYGFAIVGFIYVIAFVIAFKRARKILERPMIMRFSKKFFNEYK